MESRVVRVFDDGTSLEFDRGKFDEWCVYERDTNGQRKAPRDEEYFRTLTEFAEDIGADDVYQDFVQIYDRTGVDVTDECLILIDEISEGYGHEAAQAAKTFTTMYMGMIAEENKRFTKLGKRIKRLGVHSLLVSGAEVREAANFMKGMGWREIDRLCRERGF